jgi:hypothetical protein
MLPLLILVAITIGESDLDQDEEAVFFSAYAARADDGHWRATVRGWIYEIDAAPAIVSSICEQFAIAVPSDSDIPVEAAALLTRRASPFLVDNERGQRVAIRVGDRTLYSDPSGKNGHFILPIRFSEPQVADLRRRGDIAGGWLRYTAVVKPGDGRVPRGDIQFISPAGLSVISDIDDTIKISDVRDKKTLMINTFLKPFVPAPGMAELYRSWAKRGDVAFHYVSASPYQLYGPLRDFVEAERFPRGTFFLKPFRVKDSSLLDFLGRQDDFKLNTIQPILADFPHRKFILVGDSGEQDPEIYAELARRNPRQIEHIYIRNTTNEPSTAPRYADAFHHLDQTQWTIFEDPATLLDEPSAPASRSQ